MSRLSSYPILKNYLGKELRKPTESEISKLKFYLQEIMDDGV